MGVFGPVSAEGLRASVEKMRREGVGDAAIETFRHYYAQLEAGERGFLRESDLEPLTDLPTLDSLPEPGPGAREALDATIVLKLNGGLGTSMGMTQAKSLLPVKDGLTFLDVIVRQVLDLRERHGARLPLVLMNSFSTREDTLRALERYPELASDVPPDFVQNKEPKLLVEDLTPAQWPANPRLEWAPPGHGDLYTALVVSGMLDTLLERGYEYAFMSNSDNLGAVLEPRILAWFAAEGLPFLSEVVDRTEADRKGGHLARRRTGGLVLRETVQVADEDQAAYQDVGRHPYFHVNNLWLSLRALQAVMRERGDVLGLPLIVNRKTVDPADKTSPAVYQLETAMGAAIGAFDGARALHVPRRRFAPVKTTNDLLALRSDAYVLTEDFHVELAPERPDGAPLVSLDEDYYKRIRDFDARFADGPPSLVQAERLTVRGDVAFGAGVVVRGRVEVEGGPDGQRRIEDGAVLEG
jgi:UTP--glucose-1-phosphate uridylyltransferase